MPDIDTQIDQLVDASHALLDPSEEARAGALASRLLAEQDARASVAAPARLAARRARTRRLRCIWRFTGSTPAGNGVPA